MIRRLPPRAGRAPLDDRSGALFSLDAEDLAFRYAAAATGGGALLAARTGQVPTFTRAGAAMTADARGFLVPVAHSEPRVEAILNGSTYEPCLLIERAATNALTFPEDFSNAAWTKTNVTVSANAVAAPVATLPVTADAIMESAITAVHQVTRTISSLTANTNQSVRLFVRPNGRTRIQVYLNAGADNAGVDVTLTGAGTIANVVAGAGTVAMKRVQARANGWYEIEFAAKCNAATTSVDLIILLHNGTTTNYAGDTTKGVYLWGAMFEKDVNAPGTYIDTSRVADVLTYPFLALPQPMTLYARFVFRAAYQVDQVGILGVGGGATPTDPRVLLYLNPSGFAFRYDDVPTQVTAELVTGTAPTVGEWVEMRGVLRSDGAVQLGVSLSGGAEQVSTVTAAATPPASLAAWGAAQIDVGRFSSASTGLCPLRKLRVLPGERTLAECRGAR